VVKLVQLMQNCAFLTQNKDLSSNKVLFNENKDLNQYFVDKTDKSFKYQYKTLSNNHKDVIRVQLKEFGNFLCLNGSLMYQNLGFIGPKVVKSLVLADHWGFLKTLKLIDLRYYIIRPTISLNGIFENKTAQIRSTYYKLTFTLAKSYNKCQNSCLVLLVVISKPTILAYNTNQLNFSGGRKWK
jgi:hypothetical protein